MNARNEMTTISSPAELAVEVALDITSRIVHELSLHPECIKIEESRLGRTLTVKAQVHRGDMRRVIGSGGAHAKAINAIVEMIGAKCGQTIRFQLLEPEVGEMDDYAKFAPRDQWEREKVTALFRDISDAVFKFPAKVEIFDGTKGESVLEIETDGREPMDRLNIATSMRPLVNAIGRAHGRIMSLNVAPGIA